MDIETVFVPVDGSSRSSHAVEVAVAIAERYGGGIHALYLLDHDEESHTEEMMVATQMAAGDVHVGHSSAYGFDTSMLAHHPGSVILDASDDVGADFIVIPRQRPSDLLGKAASYVLQYAEQPVLSL
ncbi:universal stress protein [Halomarina oriensis]|uniref:Universal stress protein n=1 Tax=Halomarina oriensis TaxID=671145 RepID=A0A6B0GM25_9EURY|nr:universal stress protein [Halomarina oriensis]MWG34951.1 universal stress protein [Halomarina oriensis]